MKFVLVLLAALTVGAQETATTATTDTATPETTSTAAATTTAARTTATTTSTTTTEPEDDDTAPTARVISVKGPRKNGRVHLGEEVEVGVRGYAELRRDALARQKPVTLWLNGLDTKLERTGEAVLQGGEIHVLTFRLTRTNDNKDLWRNLLRDPFGEPTQKLALSIGISEDMPLLLADDVSATLTLQKTFFTAAGVFWVLLILLIVVLLLRYASDMLRGGPDIDNKKQAFSLGRSQMAWWFVLIIVSYITIWLITGDRDTITTSLLVLMGISAATAMGSVAIDAGAPARATDVRNQLQAERTSLATTAATTAATAETPHTNEAAAAMTLRMAEIDQTVANVTKPPITTGSWLRDVLTDNTGTVALHRFQILAWTVVLGFIFLSSVARDLSMPEFNTTLLALMGISAGTYLGFKLPSNGG